MDIPAPAATGFFEVTNHQYKGLTYLTHGVECEVEVWYRLSPDEPRDAHRRTFTSIAANISLAEYYVSSQVNQWERQQRDASARELHRRDLQEARERERRDAEMYQGDRTAVQS